MLTAEQKGSIDYSKLKFTTKAFHIIDNTVAAFYPEYIEMKAEEQATIKKVLLGELMKDSAELREIIGKEFFEQMKIWVNQ